jgi:hypothetical protein
MQRAYAATLVVASLLVAGRLDSYVGPCPKNMVLVAPTVCMDQFEWPNVPGVKPRLGISGVAEKHDLDAGRVEDAERLCASVGKRVCTDKEWVAGCRGPDGAPYPFGKTLPKYTLGKNDGLCNYDKFYVPIDAKKAFERDPAEMARVDQSEPSGARRACRSEDGVFDTIGNAEEWVRCKQGKWGWCLAGRFWSQPVRCDQMVVSHSPRWDWPTTGARCCSDVEAKE